jgi:hypothetical protein
MPQFALTPDPAGLDAPDWLGSVHRGPCYVVAATERRARVHAANAFVARAARTPGGLLLASPWTCPASWRPSGRSARTAAKARRPRAPSWSRSIRDPRGAYRLWVAEPTAA